VELKEKLEGVRQIAEGVAPERLLQIALGNMERGHHVYREAAWEEVPHLLHAEEEAGEACHSCSVITSGTCAAHGRGGGLQ